LAGAEVFSAGRLQELTPSTPATTGAEADAFNVGLSHKSLQACQKALSRNTASWATNDGSFWVVKGEGKVTLIFKLQGPPLWHEGAGADC
jgi:hypothetical protein